MSAMTASLSNPPPVQMAPSSATRSLAGVRVPDSSLISLAIEYAREHSEPYLFNHVMRSWLFAESLAQLDGVEHDGEVLALATLLHETQATVLQATPTTWRLMLDSATWSRSNSTRRATPLRASASTVHEPTPPRPTTATLAARKGMNPAPLPAPLSRG